MTSVNDTTTRPKRYVSERGPFEITANPPMSTGYTWEGVDAEKAVEGLGDRQARRKTRRSDGAQESLPRCSRRSREAW